MFSIYSCSYYSSMLSQKIASPIDNLNRKCYSERELLRITANLEQIVKTYEEYL